MSFDGDRRVSGLGKSRVLESLWKDVGEITQGHVMGDARAAIGIHPAHGPGKGKTPEHELVAR